MGYEMAGRYTTSFYDIKPTSSRRASLKLEAIIVSQSDDARRDSLSCCFRALVFLFLLFLRTA